LAIGNKAHATHGSPGKPNDCGSGYTHTTQVKFLDSNSGTQWEVRAEYRGHGFRTGFDFYRTDGGRFIEIECYWPRGSDEVEWLTSCVDPVYPVDINSSKATYTGGFIQVVHSDTMFVTCYPGRGGIYKACDNPNFKGLVRWGDICPGTRDCARWGVVEACNEGENFCGSGGNSCDQFERRCIYNGSNRNVSCGSALIDNNNASCANKNGRCFNDSQCGNGKICTGNNGTCGSCVSVCSISGVVYVDENNDGKLDDNDRRMANAEVQLTNFAPNRTDKTNTNGVYSFGNIRQGTQNDVRLINPDSGRFRIEGNNPRNNQTCSDDPNFRLTRREYSINGTVWVDNNGTGGLQTGGNNPDGKYRRGATITAAGKTDKTGTNPPNIGDFTIGGFLNGDYNVRLSGLSSNYTVVTNNNLENPREATINDGNANNVNFLVRQDAPDTSGSINGTIYVNTNGQAGLQTAASGGVPADTRLKNYQGGNTNPNLRITATTGTTSLTSGAVNSTSQFTLQNVPYGTYSIRVAGNSSGIINHAATAPNPRNNLVVNGDENNINFLLAPQAANTFSISGGVFLDGNSDGIKQTSEPFTTGAANNPYLSVTAGSQSDASSGQFNLSGFAAGNQTVTVGNPPAGFRLTWPTSSRSVSVTTGAGCTPNGNDHWDCTGNNVTNLNIGIEADTQVDRWIQAEGGDIRVDNGILNEVPGINYFSANNYSEGSATMTFGVVIGQGINIGGAARANEKSWLVNNSTFKSNTVRTSYAQVISNLKKGGAWNSSKPMFAESTRPCEGSEQGAGKCELKATINPGIYKSNKDVTLQNPPDSDYTFGAGDYVFVIDGNLRIETNITVPIGTTVMFISNGNITVANDITNIAGIFSANGDFIVQNPTGGDQGSQLQIRGSVIANAGLKNRQSGLAGAFKNARDLNDENTTTPSVLFTYRPDFILNAPEIFKYSTFKIQEIAPQSIEGALRGGSNPGGGGGGQGGGGGGPVEETCVNEETNAEFCKRVGNNANCDSVSGLDKCGKQRTVPSCGACTVAGQTCGGGGIANKCGATCTETNAQFCARVGKNCGNVTGTSCGETKTFNCNLGTPCPDGQTCGGGGIANKCGKKDAEPEDKFPFYCQYGGVNKDGVLNDANRWNYRYDGGKYCDIAGSGCTMTSLAMIMTYFGEHTTPDEASQKGSQNKYDVNLGCQSPGTLTSQLSKTVMPWLRNKGYKVPGGSNPNMVNFQFFDDDNDGKADRYRGRVELKTLKEYLDNGFLLLGGAKITYASGNGLGGPAGHAFVITDINVGDKSMTIYDPTFCKANRSGGKRTIKNVNDLTGPIGCDSNNNCGWSLMMAINN